MELQINPSFRDLIPKLTPDEFKTLEENIIRDGCLDALMIWNSTIIDGHNRYEICTKNGIQFDTHELEFSDEADAKIWIIKHQFGRRNISEAVRIQLAHELEPLLAAKAKKTQGIRTDLLPNLTKSNPANTRTDVAKIAGVSAGTYYKGKTVLEKGTEDTKQKMLSGEKSIHAAYVETVTKEPDKTKKCTSCGKELPASEFYQGRYFCKKCWDAQSLARKNQIAPDLLLTPPPEQPTKEYQFSEEQDEYLHLANDFLYEMSRFESMPRAFKGLTEESEIYQTTQKLLKRMTKIMTHMGGN